MAFRKVSYLLPSRDGCGLAWSFFDPSCVDGIPPHFASRAAALEQSPRDYDWQIRSRRAGRPRGTAWPHRRGVRDATWRRLVRWIGAWQRAASDLVAYGKAPRNGVQITYPATITVRGGA
jgi:hypothetical protein